MSKLLKKAEGTFSFAAILSVALLSGPSDVWAQQKKAGGLKQQITGTWSLVAQYVEQGDKKVERFGPNPKGTAIFEQNGRFASILLSPDIPKFASNNAMTGTAEENKAVVQRSTAFYGKWFVNEKDNSMSTHIEGSTFPNWDGQDQKRTATVSGDEMKLCVPSSQIGGNACSVWKRIK